MGDDVSDPIFVFPSLQATYAAAMLCLISVGLRSQQVRMKIDTTALTRIHSFEPDESLKGLPIGSIR